MSAATTHRWLARDALARLLALIRDGGYRLIGPTVRDQAIVYDDIDGVDDLPIGWTDVQAPGRYRLERRDDDAVFGHVVGPHSWKRFLFPSRDPLVQIRRDREAPAWTAVDPEGPPMAFVGVRPCDLAAIGVQDRVFLGGPFRERRYAGRRERALIVAVNCVEAGDLCFCASMDTGPAATGGYDLCLTELVDGFVAEPGSDAGRDLLDRLDAPGAGDQRRRAAEDGVEACRASMGRSVDRDDLAGTLLGNLDHFRWSEVAARCLSCGNCTQVCPTCFCFDVEDVSLIGSDPAVRERSWDSCFSQAHSTIHGAAFQPTTEDRYRQWLTHKFASWESQFGVSGCVGCGRCIAWCPVGIDVTEELDALRGAARPAIEVPAPRDWPISDVDPLVPAAVAVTEVTRETADVVTLVVEAPPGFDHRPGQFNMLSLPAIGDVPISISGSGDGLLEHTVRGVGAATRALCALRPGDHLGLRGPFGSAWPLDEARGRPVVVIAGGIGLAPLRGAIRAILGAPADYPHLRVLYGTRSPDDIIYDAELLGWDSLDRADVSVTVDRGNRRWLGNVGVVTRLMRRPDLSADATYLICGPEIMMRHAVHALDGIGVPETRIFVTMERNMKCAAGFCGRCQYGPYFVCKDGPVFRYDSISFLFGRPGF